MQQDRNGFTKWRNKGVQVTEKKMFPRFKFLGLMGLLLILGACDRHDGDTRHHGVWDVDNFIAPETAEMSPEEAERMLGTRGVYTRHIARFHDMQCLKPSYEHQSLDVERFTEDFGMEPGQVGLLDDNITRIDITCHDNPLERGSILFIKDEDTLITIWEGVFFQMHRSSGSPMPAR
jgi:hypothetical protein